MRGVTKFDALYKRKRVHAMVAQGGSRGKAPLIISLAKNGGE
jgi:hypothetical protein